jgi:hypothetical protein
MKGYTSRTKKLIKVDLDHLVTLAEENESENLSDHENSENLSVQDEEKNAVSFEKN